MKKRAQLQNYLEATGGNIPDSWQKNDSSYFRNHHLHPNEK